MTNMLWTVLGAIIALNVVVLTGAAVSLALEKRRMKQEATSVESAWREVSRPFVVPAELAPSPAEAHRPRRARLAGVAIGVAVICAGTALANEQAREAVVAMLGTVADGLQLTQSDPAAPPDASIQAPSSSQALGPASRSLGASEVAAPGSGSEGSIGPEDGAAGAVPSSPVTVTADAASSSQVNLAWGDVADETSYRVERSSSSDDQSGWTAVAAPGENVTAAVDTGLISGTTYFYRVFALNDGGESASSDVISATTLIDPAAPTDVSATAVSISEIVLRWSEAAGATGYRIERSLDGQTGWVGLASTGQGVTTYNDTGLSAGTGYHYRVVATGTGADSPPSAVSSATTPEAPAEDPAGSTGPTGSENAEPPTP